MIIAKRKKISVLLVEDNKLASKMSTLILEHLNCNVDAVASGNQALEYADKESYDIIFMDIGLPDIDGLSVIRHIRNQSGLNHSSPIVALTAHSDKQYIQQSFDVGASEFLIKPLSNEMGQAILQKYTQEK